MTVHQMTHALVRWTGFAFVASILAWGIWDLWLIKKGELGGGNSASAVIAEVVRAHLVWTILVTLVVGVLLGHFFFPMRMRE